MSDYSFIDFCKELHRNRWFKKKWLLIDTPESHYSFIKEDFAFKHDDFIHHGILYCMYFDKKQTFKAVVLDKLLHEEIFTLIPERDCKNVNKVYLLTKVCLHYESLYR